MLTQIINGKIFTPNGWLEDGSVIVRDDKILEVTNCDLALIGANLYDAKGMYIIPGIVSMHIHGGGGHDFTECTEEAFRAAVNAHLMHGATTIYPTLSSSPFKKLYKAAAICEKMMSEEGTPVEGLHIEGPYLNPNMAGTQYAKDIKKIEKEEYVEFLNKTHCVKRWDSSPELEGALEFASYLKSKGILAAISHTEAEYEDIRKAYEAGYSHTAHFYNAMPGFHKRREYKYEGTVESVYLTDGMSIELIADGHHLPSTILRLAYKLKGVENTALVTDALSFAADKEQLSKNDDIVIEDGVCKMADKSALAGSIATAENLIQTMVKAGVPLEDSIRMATETPARIMHVDDRKGTLEHDKDADILILNNRLEIEKIWQKGKEIC